MKFPALPPDADFAAYLVSHYHGHRMTTAKQAMLRRMRNFHATEVYPAISEALGVIAALGEFYAPPATTRMTRDDTDVTGRRVEMANGKVLQPQQVRMIRLLSDGEPRDRAVLLAEAGSKAKETAVVKAAIRNLKFALAGSGIVLEEDGQGRVFIAKPSCVIAIGIVGEA